MLVQGVLITAYAAVAVASWDGNMNYRSPSLTHAPLGINTEKVKKRMLTKRDGSYPHARNVTFTHGIASVKRLSVPFGNHELTITG
jgi:alkaline phosphatase D